jgi:hypothetical protein
VEIKWRQQHYNNSCACACLATLLSRYGIDKQDDDVITESKMPYRVRFEPGDGGYFVAGILDQSPEVFNSMLQKHRLMLARPALKDRTEFLKEAEGLLSLDVPFMTTVPTHILPSPGYDELRQRGEVRRNHAVVVYAADGREFSVLDPSGGLDRTKTQVFEMVRSQVDLRVGREALCAELEARRRPFLVDSLAKWDGKQAVAILDLLNRTRAALEEFVKAADRFGADVQGSSPDRHEDILYDYLGRCFKPIALDWRTAVEAQKERGQAQYRLIGEMYDLQEAIMGQQKELESRPSIGADFCKKISESARRIQQSAQAHLSSAYTLR